MGGLGVRLHAEGSGHHYLHPLLLSNPCRIPHHAKLQPNEGAEEEKPEYLRVLATIAAFTVYVFVIEPAGFLLSSIVYLFAQITILAPKEKRGIKGSSCSR